MSSNGTGLGHLTRSMAIARRLDPRIEPLFLTLSRAAPIVRQVGFPVEYTASHGSPGAGTDWSWSRRIGGRLRAVIAEADPRLLLFDGILPYDPLLAAMRSVPLSVWCRRPLWRPEASTAPLTRSDLFDAILEPGEFAAEEDTGPTRRRDDEVHEVPPIVFCDDDELLPRAEAARELGLDPTRPTILVQLGQGPEVASATGRCLRALAAHGGVQVAAASSTIAGALDVPDGVVHVRSTYPMSRYYAAVDGAVSAAGYNGFHELVRFRVPTLFIPMQRETDDQAARARYAARRGVGLAVDSPRDESLEQRLEELVDRDRRTQMHEQLGDLRPENGASEAARWLEELVDGSAPGDARRGPGKPPQPGREDSAKRPTQGRGRGFPGARRASPGKRARAWVFVRTLPRTIERLVRQTISLPRPRTIVLAFGADGNELERDIHDALERTPDALERVLVVTDSLELGSVWRLAVGIEHVPGPHEREVELAGLDYATFRRRRLGLIVAKRPRFRRVLAVGDVPSGLRRAALASPRRRTRLLR